MVSFSQPPCPPELRSPSSEAGPQEISEQGPGLAVGWGVCSQPLAFLPSCAGPGAGPRVTRPSVENRWREVTRLRCARLPCVFESAPRRRFK